MSAAARYAPRLEYLCDDPDCCWNGCPIVTCRTCRRDWPCDDYRATHTPRPSRRAGEVRSAEAQIGRVVTMTHKLTIRADVTRRDTPPNDTD